MKSILIALLMFNFSFAFAVGDEYVPAFQMTGEKDSKELQVQLRSDIEKLGSFFFASKKEIEPSVVIVEIDQRVLASDK